MSWQNKLSREYFSEFKGRGVIVAGGASGIGAALADGLSWLGAKVVVVDRGKTPGGIAADLSDEKQRTAALKQACQRAAQLKAFVSTIGMDSRISFDTLTQKDTEQLMRVNFFAPFFSARDVMPALRKAGGGAVCFFTSRHGSELYEPDMSGYGCAKAALDSGLKRLAVKAGEENTPDNIIRVFGFCPGWVQSANQTARFSKKQFKSAAREQLVPLGMSPEDIVPAIIYGLSSHAKLLSGTTLRYDGGEGQIRNGTVSKGSRR